MPTNADPSNAISVRLTPLRRSAISIKRHCDEASSPTNRQPDEAMYHLEITRDLDSLLANESLWNGLASGVPFRETSWLAPWWNCFGKNKEAYVVVARDDHNTIRGLLPLYRSCDRASRRTLTMIGDGDACSDDVSLLVEDDDAVNIARDMGRFLASCASDRNDGWDVLSIDGVVEGDRPMTEFASTLKECGASLHAQSRMSTWFKPTDASWNEHLTHFSKTQRRKMRRWSETIDKTDGMEKVVAESIDQVDDLLGELITLHQRRWNEVGEPGSYANSDFRKFIFASSHDFHRRGRLHLPTLSMNGRTIAGELHFVGGNRQLYCYSSAFDVDSADLEPGRILCTETLLHLYREEMSGIDYLRGDEPYKKRMSATPRRLFHFRAVAPTCLPRLRHAAWRTSFELKQWMRRRTGRKPIEVADLSVAK